MEGEQSDTTDRWVADFVLNERAEFLEEEVLETSLATSRRLDGWDLE